MLEKTSWLSDPYVKFKCGGRLVYKSRTVYRDLNPIWDESFTVPIEDPFVPIGIKVFDYDWGLQDDFMGSATLDLTTLELAKTAELSLTLQDPSRPDASLGEIILAVTLHPKTQEDKEQYFQKTSRTQDVNKRLKSQIWSSVVTIVLVEGKNLLPCDPETATSDPYCKFRMRDIRAWHRTFHNIKDVGHLTVKVFKAQGLASADLGGKSDPFCVLELGNARLQTQTEYKTLTPSWNKIFTFNVKDINNVLEITVYDEDRDHKVEFLGKIAIPLLRIRNGEKRWFALKDKKLRTRAKGNGPQILLEMIIQWNPIRACIRTLNPREEKYMQTEVKFKRQVFVKNVLRLKVFVMYFLEFGKLFQNCFEWESKLQSFAALVVWVTLCYYFQPWMFPILVLLVFLKQYIVRSLSGPLQVPWDESQDSDGEDDDEEDKEKEEKKSLKERLQAIQEVTQGVQNAIGRIASLLEGIKNMFNFTVPYLSCIAIFLLAVATVVLYILPIRYLLMLWGVNKFFRRILRPHSVPNNEILDLLSRIPDDEMLTYIKLLASGLSTHLGRLTVIRWYLQLDYKDLKLLMNNEPADRRREPKKKQKTS
uniref:Multiple C2 and transmembrane domain-containing protein-like n=1 Tax=Diabrotica virgifera virgifera TaxID=50390 RepID=A0A6P7FUY8_DIAVI